MEGGMNNSQNPNLSQLQGQFGGGEMTAEKQKAREERVQQQEEAKCSILAQLMDQQSRARLNTLKLSKPEKAAMVEQMIIRMSQMGQISSRIDDNQLVSLLESLNSQMPKSASKVKFDRRRAALDSDDDDDFIL